MTTKITDINSSGSSLSETQIPAMTCPSRGPRFWTLIDGTSWFCGDYANFEGRAAPVIPEDPSEPAVIPWNQRSGENTNFDFYSGLISRSGVWRNQQANPSNSNRYTHVQNIGTKNCTDGLSNTLLLGEASQDSQAYSGIPSQAWTCIGNSGGVFAPGYFTNGRFNRPNHWNRSFKGDDEPRYDVPEGNGRKSQWGDQLETDEQGFGSAHPGVIVSVFGDGSTRVLSFDTDVIVFRNMCERNDGLIVENL